MEFTVLVAIKAAAVEEVTWWARTTRAPDVGHLFKRDGVFAVHATRGLSTNTRPKEYLNILQYIL